MHEFDIPAFPHETESYEYAPSGVLSESQEYELAAELMEINSEQEFEQFLGDLINRVGKAAGSFIKGPIGQALGSALKPIASKLLPMAGQALGGAIGGPAGSQIGGQLASAAGSIFGLELEQSEQEFEAAQTFVRLASDAVKNAANAPAGANPIAIARAAVTQAAQTHAPGILAGAPAPMFGGQQNAGFQGGEPSRGGGHSGRWVRHGGKVILFGV